MLGRLRRWFEDRARARAAHDAAWADLIKPGADSFSPFQHEAERRVLAALGRRNLAFAQRTVHHAKSWDFIEATVPALGARIWIFVDQVDVHVPSATFHHEYWDVPTPEVYLERLEQFIGGLRVGHVGDAA